MELVQALDSSGSCRVLLAWILVQLIAHVHHLVGGQQLAGRAAHQGLLLEQIIKLRCVARDSYRFYGRDAVQELLAGVRLRLLMAYLQPRDSLPVPTALVAGSVSGRDFGSGEIVTGQLRP